MKKFLAVVLTFFYLTVISGVTLHLHYCGGKIASVRMVLSEVHTCTCGSKAMKKGCCKNESLSVKIDVDQKCSSVVSLPSDSFNTVIAPLLSPTVFLPALQPIATITNYHAPPPRNSTSLLIFNSIFRV